MIGVISKAGQAEVVKEFFELFKTPWEVYRSGQSYDVVIVTADEVPAVNARLLVVCGPDKKAIDELNGTRAAKHCERVVLSNGALSLPVYGKILTFADSSTGTPCITGSCGIAGLKIASADATVLRLGYDLFEEVRFLLSIGQPVECAHIPALDIHIRMLKNWMLERSISFLEIPPSPAGHDFAVCLTHDIDFVGIRNHRFDHTMWGFLYRSTAGVTLKLFRGRMSLARVLRSWLAAASLPFVHLGLIPDFWEPFEWYLGVEKGLDTTYFLIPFKGRRGERVPGMNASRRAAAYDLDEMLPSIAKLKAAGCELGVHGIDAWHDVEKGREERSRLAEITEDTAIGIRMHWLLQDADTVSVLEQSGYAYDSTVGYNETIGYRAGTGQVFRPCGAKKLLELPVHVQDGALFYPQRLDLSEPEAEARCRVLMDNAAKFGGVLTFIWHDRSHAPERLWGDFYIRLLQDLKSFGPWFASASQVVGWFQKRRNVRFERVGISGLRVVPELEVKKPGQPLNLRIHQPSPASGNGKQPGQPATTTDFPWDGKNVIEFNPTLQRVFEVPAAVSVL